MGCASPAGCVAALLTVVMLSSGGTPAFAVTGDLDASFGTSGAFFAPFVSTFPGKREQRVVADALSRPVVAATLVDGNSKKQVAVFRLTTGGILDTTFNAGGPTPGVLVVDFQQAGCDHTAARGLVLAGTDIIVVGDVCDGTATPRTGVARIDSTGAYVNTFDGDGRRVESYGLASPAFVNNDADVDSMGRIYVAGYRAVGAGRRAFIARFTSTGVLDTTYNALGTVPGLFEIANPMMGGTDFYEFNAIDVLADGHAVAAGTDFVTDPQVNRAMVARVLAAGTLDASFNAGGARPGIVSSALGVSGPSSQAIVYGVAVNPDESIVFTGFTIMGAGAFYVAKLTSAGAFDATFAVGGALTGVARNVHATVGFDLALQSDGKILATGKDANGTDDIMLTRFTSVGQIDATFKPGSALPGTTIADFSFNDSGEDVAVDAEGRILVAGAVVDDPTVMSFQNGAVVLRFTNDPVGPSPTATSTPTATATKTATPTASPTATRTPTPTISVTVTATASRTPTPTSTATPTATASRTPTPTSTAAATASRTPTPTATGPTPTPGVLGSFECYSVAREKVAAIAGVAIGDRFGQGTADLRRPTRLCAPADRSGNDPAAPRAPGHLLGYELSKRTPRFLKVKDVTVAPEAFAAIDVDVIRPVLLLAPTRKGLSADPGVPGGLGLDRFQCYLVKGAKTRADDLVITDQFGSITEDVKRPFRLCVPADANGGPVLHTDQALMCYVIRPARRPRFTGRGPLFVHDQFQARTIAIKKPTELCVPATVSVPVP